MPGPGDLDLSWLTKFVRDQIQQNQLLPQTAAKVATHNVGDLVASGDISIDGVRQPKITTSTITVGPPMDPKDGDVWIATKVDSSGTRWQFQYDVTDNSRPWKFIGGPAVVTAVTGNLAGTSTVTDFGGTYTTVRDGLYLLSGCYWATTAGAGVYELLYRVGGVGGAVDGAQQVTAAAFMAIPGIPRAVTATAGNGIGMAYWANAAATLGAAALAVTPISIK